MNQWTIGETIGLMVKEPNTLVCARHVDYKIKRTTYRLFSSISDFRENMKKLPPNYWTEVLSSECCFCCRNMGNSKEMILSAKTGFCVRVNKGSINKYFGKSTYLIVNYFLPEVHVNIYDNFYVEDNTCCVDMTLGRGISGVPKT